MGMIKHKALANIVEADNDLLFDVPDEWSLEDAATIVVVYGTVLLSYI